MRRLVIATLTLIGLVYAAPAFAGDFVDTRLNLTLSNENVLVKPGETNPSVPGWRFGRPNSLGVLFFDNYDTRFTGFENLAHLIVYKKMETARVVAEGAFLLRMNLFTDVNLSAIDGGSYIRVQYFFDRTRQSKMNLSFVAFPTNSDRMRLGYSYRLSWGGSPMFFKLNPDLPVGAAPFVTNTSPAPGAKLQLSDDRWYIYVGAKTSLLLNRNPAVNEQEAVGAFLFGAGGELIKNRLRLEGNFGYFDRGNNPLFYGTSIGAQGGTFSDFPVFTIGGGGQLSIYGGMAPSQSIDLTLYRNDPTSAQRFFVPRQFSPQLAWLVQAEFSALGTALQDANRANSTRLQLAYAGDINVRVQKGAMRFKTDLSTRSLSFILINQPSLVPFQDFPDGSVYETPELFASVGFDWYFRRIGLTLGPTIGVMRPATFAPPPGQLLSAPLVGNTGGSLATSGTIVVRNEGDYSILPVGQEAVPLMAIKAEARLDFLEWFSLLVQVLYQYDNNQTRLLKAPDGTSTPTRQFAEPNQLGFNFSLQARY